VASKTTKKTIARIAKATECVDSDRRTTANAKQRLRDRITIRGNARLKARWEAIVKGSGRTSAEWLEEAVEALEALMIPG